MHRNCSRIRLFALLAAAAMAAAGAEGIPKARPEEVGLSSERLARIRTMMNRYLEREQIAGAVTLVARRGRVVHLETHGLADREAAKPMRQDTIFRIASMTKPITSVAVMMLHEEGHFQLNDPVSKFIPEFKDVKVAIPLKPGELGSEPYRLVPAERPISIRHLLSHTAGLANSYAGVTAGMLSRMERKPEDTVGDMTRRLAKLPLNFHPGTAWEYGPATDVLGFLVEVVSGMPLDRFFEERIFKPLGMTETFFYPPQEKVARVAAVYAPGESKGIRPMNLPVRTSGRYFSGAGGLMSTASDYVRFCQMSLNGGQLDGARLISRKSVEAMTANHIGDLPGWLVPPGHRFGLGYSVLADLGASGGLGTVGRYGWGGAYGTHFWIDPKEQLIGIIMIQIRPYTHLNIRQDFQTVANQAIVE